MWSKFASQKKPTYSLEDLSVGHELRNVDAG